MIPLYDWALLLYVPSALLGAWFDWRDRAVPAWVIGVADKDIEIPLVSIPAFFGAVISLYLLWTGQVSYMDPWIAILFVFLMVAVAIAGIILIRKNLTAGEDVVTMVLYAATPGSILIFIISGIITFIHVIYRRFAGLTTWEYMRNDSIYSYYPYPVLFYMAVGYFIWLASTLR